jgi:N-acetyl sugar amidotransferase
MDTSDSDIHFDSEGVCSHCNRYDLLRNVEYENSSKEFQAIIDRIKKRGKSYPYDCIVAFSGGTDSSYMLHKLKDCGLRVLAAHYNSGWNTEEANHNVKSMTDIIGVDLYEYTVGFEEFRALQIAYLKAGVIDLDVPTDHALYGSLYQAAVDKNVPFILTGHNFETECVMGDSWVTDKLDSKNLLDIYNQYGDGTPLKSFPIQTLRKKFVNYNIRKIEMIFILNYLDYDKEKASEEMKALYGWERVRVKHGESIWTRFYQCHILPTRFGVDKRRAHFSNLILSGGMTRNEALLELDQPAYKDDLDEDRKVIFEKYRIDKEEFNDWMTQPIRKHSDFKDEKGLKRVYAKVRKVIPGLNISTRH